MAGALANASVAWISAACAVVGAGLGPSSISQVLAIQHVAPERQRGVATSLVPFFRTVGGSIGVGALGGVFTAGVAARLGSGMEAASRLLAGPHAAGAADGTRIAPALFRHAIERSLLPVFAVLLALAADEPLPVIRLSRDNGVPGRGFQTRRRPRLDRGRLPGLGEEDIRPAPRQSRLRALGAPESKSRAPSPPGPRRRRAASTPRRRRRISGDPSYHRRC